MIVNIAIHLENVRTQYCVLTIRRLIYRSAATISVPTEKRGRKISNKNKGNRLCSLFPFSLPCFRFCDSLHHHHPPPIKTAVRARVGLLGCCQPAFALLIAIVPLILLVPFALTGNADTRSRQFITPPFGYW